MALMSVDQFVIKYNGKSIDVDGKYSSQCWDLAALYGQKVAGNITLPTGNGCACGVYSNFLAPLPKYYTRIKNTVSGLPKKGDLVIWRCSLPASGGCGHIAICLSANYSSFVSFDQNWGGKYAHKVRHYWSRDGRYVVGWLRPTRKVNY